MWQWMEKGWEEWMSEKDRMVSSDKELAIEAVEQAVVEIQRKWWKVRIELSLFSYSDFDLFSMSQMIGGP